MIIVIDTIALLTFYLFIVKNPYSSDTWTGYLLVCLLILTYRQERVTAELQRNDVNDEDRRL